MQEECSEMRVKITQILMAVSIGAACVFCSAPLFAMSKNMRRMQQQIIIHQHDQAHVRGQANDPEDPAYFVSMPIGDDFRCTHPFGDCDCGGYDPEDCAETAHVVVPSCFASTMFAGVAMAGVGGLCWLMKYLVEHGLLFT